MPAERSGHRFRRRRLSRRGEVSCGLRRLRVRCEPFMALVCRGERVQRRDDAVDVVDAAGPRAAADPLQCRPEAAVGRQMLVRRRRRMHGSTFSSASHAFASRTSPPVPTRFTVPVSVVRSITISMMSSSRTPPDRTAVQRFGSDVSDARAGREPRETPVGDERDMLAPGQVAERGRDLRRLLHARCQRVRCRSARSRRPRSIGRVAVVPSPRESPRVRR